MLTRFWRWLGFHVHDWEKWEHASDILSVGHGGVVGILQSRRCESCGLRQLRRTHGH